MPAKKASGEQQDDTANAADQPVVVAGIASPTVRRADAPFSTRQQLMPSAAPDPQMVKVKEVATGRVFASWPADARELVTHPLQEHVYAQADEPLSPVGTAFLGNPTPVAPADATSPIGVDPVAPVTPPRAGAAGSTVDPVTATAALSDMSKAELQDVARKAGVDPDQPKSDLVEALQPHVTAGTVTVPGLPNAPTPLAPPPPKPR